MVTLRKLFNSSDITVKVASFTLLHQHYLSNGEWNKSLKLILNIVPEFEYRKLNKLSVLSYISLHYLSIVGENELESYLIKAREISETNNIPFDLYYQNIDDKEEIISYLQKLLNIDFVKLEFRL